MSEFRFSLQSVLRVRLAERDVQRVELADAERSQLALQSEIDRIQRGLQQLRTQARRYLLPGSIDIAHLQSCHSCEQTLKRDIDLLDRQRHEAAKKAEKCHAVLIQVDRQVRMLEKLSDKQREEHRREEGKRENRRLDELRCQSFSKAGA